MVNIGLLKCFSYLLLMTGLAAFWQSANCRSNSVQPKSWLQLPEAGLSLGSLLSLLCVFLAAAALNLLKSCFQAKNATDYFSL